MLKPESILAKYYHQRKREQLPVHEEKPPESVFKNVSVDRKNKAQLACFQQEIPKNITFVNYWEIYKDQILKKILFPK